VDVEVGGSSLTYLVEDDDALTTLREQARALSEDLRFEVGREDGFATASGGPTDAVAGLLVDDSDADEDLRELSAREADLRLRRLLERAERAADRGEHSAALATLDDALALNRASAAAWLLRGRCLVAVGEFTGAAQAVAVARRHARDRRERSLAAALAETVRRAELAAFLAELDELLGAGRATEASGRIQARLRDQPDDPVLLERLCAALLEQSSVDRAREVAENALRVVGRAGADRFEDVLRHIATIECEARMQEGRLALRRGDPATALARLEECAGAIGDRPDFQAARAYAAERLGSGTRFGAVRRLRSMRPDAAPLDGVLLQKLLVWLLDEELTAGQEALEAHDYPRAQNQFAAAAEIDDRCAAVAYLHAAALFDELLAHLSSATTPNFVHGLQALERAAALAARCADDAELGAEARKLGGSISEALTAVDAARLRAARARAVSTCVDRYNALIDHYKQNPITTVGQRDAARYGFDALARDVTQLRGELPPEGGEEEVLPRLAAELARISDLLWGTAG
jgi:tetratricopeptide (TPR) repeat protein